MSQTQDRTTGYTHTAEQSEAFVAIILPRIRRAVGRFRRLLAPGLDHEEYRAEAIGLGWTHALRLWARGKRPQDWPCVFARHITSKAARGYRVAGRTSSRCVLERYARRLLGRGIIYSLSASGSVEFRPGLKPGARDAIARPDLDVALVMDLDAFLGELTPWQAQMLLMYFRGERYRAIMLRNPRCRRNAAAERETLARRFYAGQ